MSSQAFWMVDLLTSGVAGMVLTLKTFRGIVSGEMTLLFWSFKRDANETRYWVWMSVFMLLSLALYAAALRCYLGPLWFF